MAIKTAAPAAIRPPATVITGSGSDDLWSDAPTEITRRAAVVEVYGDTGTGRSTFALSSPGPIAYLFAAEKTEGVVQRTQLRLMQQGHKLRLHNFGAVFTGTDGDEIKIQASPVWDKLLKAYYDALGWARTIVLDTHTDAWELIRVASFGGIKPDGGRIDANYGPVNAVWRSMFKAARLQDRANFITIGQTKDEWITKEQAAAAAAATPGAGAGKVMFKGSKQRGSGGSDGGIGQRTGRTVRAGQREIGVLSDVVVRTGKEMGDRGPEFSALIEKAWYNAEYEGAVLTGKMVSFPYLMSLITETDEAEWSK